MVLDPSEKNRRYSVVPVSPFALEVIIFNEALLKGPLLLRNLNAKVCIIENNNRGKKKLTDSITM
jgi:hypothetical protein